MILARCSSDPSFTICPCTSKTNVNSCTVHCKLLAFPIQSNEVNQGNNLEHDFGCLYKLLLFPATHILASKIPVGTGKSMMVTWTELYKTFARLAAMVANAEENICCEELCHEISSHLLNNPEKLEVKGFPCKRLRSIFFYV